MLPNPFCARSVEPPSRTRNRKNGGVATRRAALQRSAHRVATCCTYRVALSYRKMEEDESETTPVGAACRVAADDHKGLSLRSVYARPALPLLFNGRSKRECRYMTNI